MHWKERARNLGYNAFFRRSQKTDFYRKIRDRQISEISEPAGPGREVFGRRRLGRELEPGRPFMDLLPKSSKILQNPLYFLPRAADLLIFIEIH